jgi:hypothetical protein
MFSTLAEFSQTIMGGELTGDSFATDDDTDAQYTAGEHILGGYIQRAIEEQKYNPDVYGSNPPDTYKGMFEFMIESAGVNYPLTDYINIVLQKKQQIDDIIIARSKTFNLQCKKNSKENKTLYFSLPEFTPSKDLVNDAAYDTHALYILVNGLANYINELSAEPLGVMAAEHQVKLLSKPASPTTSSQRITASTNVEKELVPAAHEYELFAHEAGQILQNLEKSLDYILANSGK